MNVLAGQNLEYDSFHFIPSPNGPQHFQVVQDILHTRANLFRNLPLLGPREKLERVKECIAVEDALEKRPRDVVVADRPEGLGVETGYVLDGAEELALEEGKAFIGGFGNGDERRDGSVHAGWGRNPM